MIRKSVLLIIIIAQLALASLFAAENQGTIIRNERGPLMSLVLQSDDAYVFNNNGSYALDIYSKEGALKGGYDTSYFDDDIIPIQRRRMLPDFDIVADKGIYLLLAGSQFQGMTPESLILKFPEVDNLLNPIIIQLDKKIASHKLRVDSAGNYYILGMDEPDFRKIIMNESSADCPILHKFNAKGKHVYSTLVRHVNPLPREYSLTYSSPIVAPSNFAVSPEGEVWLLWDNLTESVEEGIPVLTLFNIDGNGQVKEVNPTPPESGYMLTSVTKNAISSEVLFAWKRISADIEFDTILTKSNGEIYLKGNFPGRILSINNKTLITTILKDGRHAVLKYSY